MKTHNTEIENIASNIVYQLGDLYELDVDLRQRTNDKAIDFAKGLINSLLTNKIKEIEKDYAKDFDEIYKSMVGLKFNYEPGLTVNKITDFLIGMKEFYEKLHPDVLKTLQEK